MKKLYLLGAIALMAATACTSGEEPLADIDVNYIEAASRGDVAVRYTPVAQTDSIRDNNNESEAWKEYDPISYVGDIAYFQSFIIRNGKTCSRAELFTSNGPDMVYASLKAYQKSIDQEFEVYIGSDIDYQESTGKITIGTETFDVVKLNSQEANLIRYITYNYPPTDKQSLRRTEITYKAEPYVVDAAAQRDIIGEDIHDVRRQILALCREHFGDKIDLTEVYGGEFYLDAGNIIDLDEIERKIDRAEQIEKERQ